MRINKKPMVQYVVDALRMCSAIDQIAIVGPYEKLNAQLVASVDYIVECKGSIIDNMLKGIEVFKNRNRNDILVCTSDIPLLTPAAVLDFVNMSANSNADFCYPIVEKSIIKDKYPEIERTYVKLKDGSFTGGNIFYIKPDGIKACVKRAEQLINSRKNPAKMARVLGTKILVAFLLGRLSINEAEKKFSEVFGIKAKAVTSNFPELANDVDKPAHLEYIQKILQKIL